MIMYDNTIYVDARIYECAILDEDMRIGEAFCMYGAMQKWIFLWKTLEERMRGIIKWGFLLTGIELRRLNKQLK